MRVTLAAVGTVKRASPEHTLFEKYQTRLTWPVRVTEIAPTGPDTETTKLLRATEKCDAVFALDETGDALSSEAFAHMLQDLQNQGDSHAGFLIGGADGLDLAQLKGAHKLCFGPMTWPHQLVRGLLMEQLYRAQSILNGHPYHRA